MPNTTISSAAVNSDLSDIATALTNSIAADGQTPITGSLLGAAGSSSAPGWAFANDTSTGMYLPSVGQWGLVSGGVGIKFYSAAHTITAAAPSNPGNGYAVGDTVVLSGGVGVLNPILTVASISGVGGTGPIASVSVLAGGNLVTVPGTFTQQSTSGGGTGATFTATTGVIQQLSDIAGPSLWQDLGATSYMGGAMQQGSALMLANYIGSANLAQAIQTSLPIPAPQGYLTLVFNQPVITSSVLNTNAIWYTPYSGTWNPIHNGTTFVPINLPTPVLPLVLTSSQAANGIYDVFLCYNSGSPRIAFGPGWNAGGSGGSVTPGSCARSSGAGGAAISIASGGAYLTNTAAMTVTLNTGSGNFSLSVAAGQGLYLGSIWIDATPGQVSTYVGWQHGLTNNKRGLWNFWNRQPVVLEGGDASASWTYGTNTIRQSNGNATNQVQPFTGWNDEFVFTSFEQLIGGSNTQGAIGVGYNSTTAFSGTQAQTNSLNSVQMSMIARYNAPPALGINNVNACELYLTGSAMPFFGTQADMQLMAQWRG